MNGSEVSKTPPSRRGQRSRKLSLKAAESYQFSKHSKEEVSSDSEASDCDEAKVEKPTVIHENEALQGEKFFAFQGNKRRDAILRKASEVSEASVPKTPHSFRNRLKKNIAAKIQEENSLSEHDFSDSGSEYAATEESESESEISDEDGDNSTNDDDEEVQRKPKFAATSKVVQHKPRNNKNYVIKTDDYFSNHASSKIVTSNHTLDKLKTPRLPQDQLQKLLAKMMLSRNHVAGVNSLVAANREYFNKWLHLLHENFNVLLYGLGSKKSVLEQFHEQHLKKLPVIVVNGFFPSLTIKDVLDAIILDLLELKENPANVYEACDLVEREFSYIPQTHLYLIVHNIEMMRAGKIQSIFARLAAIKNVHLIASIDHINAPLIWDHSKLSNFSFTWWDVTSFYPYLDETSFENSMLVQRTGSLALSSLRNVFLSLTSNSKGIYLILVRYQLENGKTQYYQGLAFKDLYSSCREAFLVSSDLALRAQLTEFVDHKMVKFKRAADGTEYLIIPIHNTILQQFLSEQS